MDEKLICAQCGYIGQTVRYSKGSYLLEMFLWLLLFVPGALYTVWRSFNEYQGCPVCKNKTMTPLSSQFGKKIMAEKQRMQAPPSETELAAFLKKVFQK